MDFGGFGFVILLGKETSNLFWQWSYLNSLSTWRGRSEGPQIWRWCPSSQLPELQNTPVCWRSQPDEASRSRDSILKIIKLDTFQSSSPPWDSSLMFTSVCRHLHPTSCLHLCSPPKPQKDPHYSTLSMFKLWVLWWLLCVWVNNRLEAMWLKTIFFFFCEWKCTITSIPSILIITSQMSELRQSVHQKNTQSRKPGVELFS